jgi:hypothetical protein
MEGFSTVDSQGWVWVMSTVGDVPGANERPPGASASDQRNAGPVELPSLLFQTR